MAELEDIERESAVMKEKVTNQSTEIVLSQIKNGVVQWKNKEQFFNALKEFIGYSRMKQLELGLGGNSTSLKMKLDLILEFLNRKGTRNEISLMELAVRKGYSSRHSTELGNECMVLLREFNEYIVNKTIPIKKDENETMFSIEDLGI